MFELPRYVIKAGEVLIEDGENCASRPRAKRCTSPRHTTPAIEADLARHFERYYSVRLANYPLAAGEVGPAEATACRLDPQTD